ncbi:MAG TPA: hypothetical protein VHV77_05135, partial [Pirellulales bacterium]|nr:hypothetical protein [Pirellulales bacterium]
MSAVVLEPSDYVRVWPGWWRMTVIALSTLVLCSCRAAPHATVSSGGTVSSDAAPPASEPETIVAPHVMTLATVTP